MKKILSLALAGVMMFSALPMAYAADVDYQTGTNVTVVGDGGEYFVTVPATLEPGQTGTVRAYGKWASNETVKVWTEDTVEVEHQETGAKTDVNVAFAGIESLGNDLEDMDVTANISIDKGDIRFGEWKGTIVYNVEFDDGIADTVMFYEVEYVTTTNGFPSRYVFHADGTYSANSQAEPEVLKVQLSSYKTEGQNVITPIRGTFSEDGKIFTNSLGWEYHAQVS